MKPEEIAEAEARIEQYQALEKVRAEVFAALARVSDHWPDGPNGQNPFTGNWLESRQVESITIYFSPTRGGAEKTKIEISSPHIEGHDLGAALQMMLRAKLEVLNAEMEKI